MQNIEIIIPIKQYHILFVMSIIYLYEKHCNTKIICYNILVGDQMSQNQDNFKRGTAEMLVLHLLMKEDLYGYQITNAFEEKSNGVYTMLEGSLYPILYRLTEEGCITDYTKLVGKRRMRRYYHLEDKGRERYQEILAEYDAIINSINRILDRGDDNV